MESLFISKDCKLSVDGASLLVKTDAGKRRVPVKGLKQLVIAGEAGLTTALLGLLSREQVRVVVLDWNGNVSGSFEPAGHPRSGKVRLAQAACISDPMRRTNMARGILIGGGSNILSNLRYRKYRGNTSLEAPIKHISKTLEGMKNAEGIEELMGYEGLMRATYYEAWRDINKRLDFGRRVRRPPNNPVNCLISWFNGLTYSLCRNEIAKTHLDDCLSFLHSPHEARSSLALDIAEIFKPVVADGLIFDIICRGTDIDNWFHQEEGVCRLSDTGRRKTLELWASRIDARSNGKPCVRDIVRNEALAIERHLLGIETYSAWKRKV